MKPGSFEHLPAMEAESAMTPPSVTPQGAQLKLYACTTSGMLASKGGFWVKYAEAAERIEKLERALAEARRDADATVETLTAANVLIKRMWKPLSEIHGFRSEIELSTTKAIDAARHPVDANNG